MASKLQSIINVGNVLNLIDIKKKVGQNAAGEISEGLAMTVEEWMKVHNITKITDYKKNDDEKVVNISRLKDDSHTKMSEEVRSDLHMSIKIFVQNDSAVYLDECLKSVFNTLNIDSIENVILAYSPITSNDIVQNGTDNKDETLKCDQVLPGLKVLWGVMEKYVKAGKIHQVGVADLEEMCFKSLHEYSEVKPNIIQINLASCCVVPPGLQSFCKDNDIQLLTHSDPREIIGKDTLKSLLKADIDVLRWCVRYQVHIKCRGVLALKGYMLSVDC